MRALLLALDLLSKATGSIPRARAQPWCRLAGRLWYLAAPRTRAVVTRNLTQVLGRRPQPASVRTVFEFGVLNYWDTLSIPALGPTGVARLVRLDGLAQVDDALAQGRGAIVVGAHVGSIALAVQALALRYSVTGVVEAIQPPELLHFWLARRSSLGLRLVVVGAVALRELLAALRRNEVVVIVSDRDVNGTGAKVCFFGAETTLPDGPAALALRTNAVLLPARAWGCSDGHIEGQIEDAVEVVRGGDAAADRRALTQAIARRLEYHIASHPEQWTVFEQRWPEAREAADSPAGCREAEA
jgi:phosphatidylinositol dimannoside acyltransferase